MRVVIQRVAQGQVEVEGRVVGRIGRGLLVYLSVGKGDTEEDAHFVAEKLVNLRIFPDEGGKMNRSVREAGGAVLVVSQFTLHGDCRRGRRPGFEAAAEPRRAEQLYETTVALIRAWDIEVATGIFGAHMQVSSVNDGPVTFLLDSKRLF
mgnify:CR=1 FL=1